MRWLLFCPPIVSVCLYKLNGSRETETDDDSAFTLRSGNVVSGASYIKQLIKTFFHHINCFIK